MEDGGQCVTISGLITTQQWSAGNWDSMILLEVSLNYSLMDTSLFCLMQTLQIQPIIHLVGVLDQYLWTMLTALGRNQGYGGNVHISLTTMDVPIMMMWESNVNQVRDAFNHT